MIFRKRYKIIQLWHEAFDDKTEFIRLFFKRVYSDKNALTIEEGGKILSTLQLVTYRMSYYGEEIEMAYIVGACTQKSCRKNGLMSRLMNNALDEMKARGLAIATLIPANGELFKYYAKFGFTKAFDYSMNTYVNNGNRPPDGKYILKTVNKHKAALQDYVIRKLKERPISVLHYGYDLDTIIQDIKLSPGNVFALVDKEGQNYCGMAFVTVSNVGQTDEKVLLVKELIYENVEAKEALLYYVTDAFKVKQAAYRQPCFDLQSYSYGMARVIDRERMVDLWLSNTKNYHTKEELMAMDVQTLTALLLDYSNRAAYMSLMLD